MREKKYTQKKKNKKEYKPKGKKEYKREPLKKDEEIDSEDESIQLLEEDDDNNNGIIEDYNDPSSQEANELANMSYDEKKIYLARKLINTYSIKGYDDEAIIRRLETEANKLSKKIQYNVSDQISYGNSSFIKAHLDSVTCIAVSPHNNNIVYSGSKDCKIIKHDVVKCCKTEFSGQRGDHNCGGHFAQVLDIATDETGRTLLSVGRDNLVRFWDTRSSNTKCTLALKGHTKNITGVCSEPSENLKKFYTISEDKSLKAWSLDAQCVLDTFYGCTESAVCIDLLTVDRPLTGSQDKTMRLWNCARESHLVFEGHSSSVDAVTQINPKLSISGSQDGSILLWSISNKKPVDSLVDAHDGNWISSLVSIPYSDVFFSGSDNGVIKAWSIETIKGVSESESKNHSNYKLKELSRIRLPILGFINQLAVSSNGNFLYAAVGREHRLGRWNTNKNAKNGIFIVPLENSIDTVEPETAT